MSRATLVSFFLFIYFLLLIFPAYLNILFSLQHLHIIFNDFPLNFFNDFFLGVLLLFFTFADLSEAFAIMVDFLSVKIA